MDYLNFNENTSFNVDVDDDQMKKLKKVFKEGI